jgi:hypothetical protein
MDETKGAYGATRQRGPTVSYEEIERAARALMADGERPTVQSVYKKLGRGSPNHITDCMQRFWKNQAALNAGDPIALTRLPPELADAAVAQWEQALRLSQQVAKYDDNAARSHLQVLQRDTEQRARSIELREKEWDIAARVRERALADAREQVNVLMRELATDRAQLRAQHTQIAELEAQLDQLRQQLATVVARAVAKHRSRAAHTAAPAAAVIARRRTVVSIQRQRGARAGARPKERSPTNTKPKKSAAAATRKRPRNRKPLVRRRP